MKEKVVRKRFGGIESKNSHTENWTARIALAILEKHAMVSAIPDGEDTSGRQKCRLPTAEELVKRALDLAETFRREVESRGFLLEIEEESEVK